MSDGMSQMSDRISPVPIHSLVFKIQEYCDGGTLLEAIQKNRFYDSAAKAPFMDQVRSRSSYRPESHQ